MDGFTYNGVHCETMGCAYIPDASARWFASPDIDRGKEDVSWRDGNYHYYTRRKARTFTVNCYFENITRRGRERIRRWLDEKGSGWLIFDERPDVKYFVRPSKTNTGKIYMQSDGIERNPWYNGTFTITFEASDPLGYLTRITDDDLLDNEQLHTCNLVRTDMMPAAPLASDSSFQIYNPGTVPCGVTFQLAGSAPNGLLIYNKTNNTQCRLRGLPSSGVLHIDSTRGLLTTVTQLGPEITFAYHDYDYVQLAPNDQLNYMVRAEYSAESQSVHITTRVVEDLTGMYLYLDGEWNKILTIDEDGDATMAHAPATSGIEDVHLGRMNEITISGDGMELTTLEYTFEPRSL